MNSAQAGNFHIQAGSNIIDQGRLTLQPRLAKSPVGQFYFINQLLIIIYYFTQQNR